jgi:hypothetical protein
MGDQLQAVVFAERDLVDCVALIVPLDTSSKLTEDAKHVERSLGDQKRPPRHSVARANACGDVAGADEAPARGYGGRPHPPRCRAEGVTDLEGSAGDAVAGGCRARADPFAVAVSRRSQSARHGIGGQWCPFR